MTKQQLDELIEFIRYIASLAVNDPLGESGGMYQAEKRLRAAFAVEPAEEPECECPAGPEYPQIGCPIHGRTVNRRAE